MTTVEAFEFFVVLTLAPIDQTESMTTTTARTMQTFPLSVCLMRLDEYRNAYQNRADWYVIEAHCERDLSSAQRTIKGDDDDE